MQMTINDLESVDLLNNPNRNKVPFQMRCAEAVQLMFSLADGLYSLSPEAVSARHSIIPWVAMPKVIDGISSARLKRRVQS